MLTVVLVKPTSLAAVAAVQRKRKRKEALTELLT